MSAGERVLFDANVLFSRALRDWVLMMSDAHHERSPYTACWTEDILAETVARLRDKKPGLPSGSLEAVGDRLRTIWSASQIRSFPAARDTFLGGDEGDLHLHSAAVHGGVGIIVTDDHSGLLPAADGPHSADELPYEVYTTDDFLLLVHEQAPHVVRDITLEQARHHFKRSGEADLATKLHSAGATHFAAVVRHQLQKIDPRGLQEA